MHEVQIAAHDEGKFDAYVVLPEVTPAPAVILIQEIFGVNQEMRDKCDEMAAQGYVAICPDLFWRIEPGIQLVDSDEKQLQRAFDLFGKFDVETGLADLESTLEYLRDYEACDGRVACLGYCLGGKLSYMMACETDIDLAVSYYGVAIETMLDRGKNINKPLLLHIAEEDEFVSKEAQEEIKLALLPNARVNIYCYPGMQHAFARGGGMHYNEDAAKEANDRTFKFLDKNLKQTLAA